MDIGWKERGSSRLAVFCLLVGWIVFGFWNLLPPPRESYTRSDIQSGPHNEEQTDRQAKNELTVSLLINIILTDYALSVAGVFGR